MGTFPSGVARTTKTTVVVGASTVVVAWHGGAESALIDVHVTGGSFPPGVARTGKTTVVVGTSTVVVAWVSGGGSHNIFAAFPVSVRCF